MKSTDSKMLCNPLLENPALYLDERAIFLPAPNLAHQPSPQNYSTSLLVPISALHNS